MPSHWLLSLRHGCEYDGQNVSKAEVENEDLDQGPVLLMIIVFDEVDFEFLQFFQTLRELCDNEEPEVEHCVQLWVIVDEQKQQANDVDYHVVRAVVLQYFSESNEFLARARLHCDAVVHNFEQVEDDAQVLDIADKTVGSDFGEDQSQSVRDEKGEDLEDAEKGQQIVEVFINLKSFFLKDGLLIDRLKANEIHWFWEYIVSFQFLNESFTMIFYP